MNISVNRPVYRSVSGAHPSQPACGRLIADGCRSRARQSAAKRAGDSTPHGSVGSGGLMEMVVLEDYGMIPDYLVR